jgi:D-methionine transport system substrate-binding protein
MLRFIAFISLWSLSACGHQTVPNTLTVGAIAGPEIEIVQLAAEIANQSFGLNVKVVEFSDYNLPNAALEDGSLDANIYQHLPYLTAAIKAHGYALESIGKTFIYPMALYSKKHKLLTALPAHATIAIPNDPSNEARALQLLQKAGLLKVNETPNATIKNVTANPKHLQLKELDAAQLPRILDDVDAAVINTTFAIPAGLKPSRDALFVEDKNSPYANLIVMHKNSAKKEQLLEFVKALNSPQVKEKAKALFGEGAIAAW